MPAQYFLKQAMIRSEILEMRSFLECYSDISDKDLYLMYVSPVSKGVLRILAPSTIILPEGFVCRYTHLHVCTYVHSENLASIFLAG